jgi:hypothetical protein
MNIHKNARTTPYSRLSMAQRLAAGEKATKVASGFCVSAQTVKSSLLTTSSFVSYY